MKTGIALIIIGCFFIGLSFHMKLKEPELNKSTIYTVKCVDDILEGEFVKINDKYFRHGAVEPTWIPLSQCGLEPK